MSAASERVQSASDEPEVLVPASEPSRPTEPRHLPPVNEASSPFDDDVVEDDFDFHDTIPAPPWNEDELDAVEIPLVRVP